MRDVTLPVIRRTQAVKPNSEVEEFVRLIQAGVDAWTEAGKKLVILLGGDPDFPKKIRAAHPEISSEMLIVFERIGRKQLYAPLLADSSLGARALLEMPYDVQEKYATGVIEVVTGKSGETVKRRVSELSRSEVKQVFVDGELLTPKQQLAELRARSERPVSTPAPAPAKKTTETIRCLTLTLEKDGKISSKPTANTFKCQQVRFEKQADGSYTADVLFFRNL